MTPLKVSLSRQQYEQVLDTVNGLLPRSSQMSASSSVSSNSQPVAAQASSMLRHVPLGDIAEEESEMHTGVSTLSMDSTLRARMLHQGPQTVEISRPAPPHRLTVKGLSSHIFGP